MTHAWCRDPSRDERVRAAEDGRDRPLPTLEEAIARPFADAAERSVPVSKTGEGQSAMRTERVVLEVTHYGPESAAGWEWKYHIRPRHIFESVRVVDTHAEAVAESVAWEGARDAYRGRILRLTEERDAAIRERESWKLLADRTNERLSAAEARVAELERQVDQADAEDADTGYALRLFVDGRRVLSHELGPTQAGAFLIAADHLAKYLREEYKPITDATNGSVAELEAASGGGEPVAYFVKWADKDWAVQDQTFRTRERAQGYINDEKSEDENPQIVPLYASPPQPRGWLTEEEWEAVEASREFWQVECDSTLGDDTDRRYLAALSGLLARSTPPKVRLVRHLNYFDCHGDRVNAFDAADVLAALAAAGVEVEEVGRE